MIELRRFDSLGRFDNEWLSARYHFSFADYVDPERVAFGALRVWNDDLIRAHTGFPPHGHRDMEIITYIRQGAISHEDGLGNRGRTAAGDVQVMSAGTGIRHAEFNLEDEDTRLFQIWVFPEKQGLPPRWEQARFPREERRNRLVALASGRGDEGALRIFQDAALLGAFLDPGATVEHPLAGRRAYVVVAQGAIELNGARLGPRDGAAAWDEDVLTLKALEEAELLVMDLA